jgi:hypothetical protein
VSDTPLPNVGSTDPELVDDGIQESWDRYAMPYLTAEPRSQRSPLALASPDSSNSVIATRKFDATPTYGSMTALANAYDGDASTFFADQILDVTEDPN